MRSDFSSYSANKKETAIMVQKTVGMVLFKDKSECT